jgi:hypothetical protein
MPTKFHCQYKNIWDTTTRRFRCCKNKKCHDNFCTIHYRLLYTDYAIMIQKIYKGYYIRKKLKIYYNLPRDLQRKIIWHINSDLYLRYYNSSVSKIIYRRYKEFYDKYISIAPNNTLNIYIYSDTFIEIYTNLLPLVKLSIKYYTIIKISKIPYFYNFKRLCCGLERLYYIQNLNDSNLLILQKYINLFN